jgi:hypothetical protein
MTNQAISVNDQAQPIARFMGGYSGPHFNL